jgi:glucose/arabinose dehydrogenase
VASVPGQVWSPASDPGAFTTGDLANQGYVPLSFLYGFRVTTFATGLDFPYGMQQLPDGSLLVGTSRPPPGGGYFGASGELVRFTDADADGVADGPPTVLYRGLPGPLTAVRQAGSLVLVTTDLGDVSTITVLRAGNSPAAPLSRVGSVTLTFPSGWEHHSYALAVAPSRGGLGGYDVYFNVGASANDTESTEAIGMSSDGLAGLSSGALAGASIYRFTITDTISGTVLSNLLQIASGVRNAAGIAVQPSTGDLYFTDNGIDGPTVPEEALSADELNRIPAADVGGAVTDFGFPHSYIEYRTGAEVGSGGVQPFTAFQPLPAASSNESEGPTELVFAPSTFPGAPNGVFVGFHGQFAQAGVANDEHPVVYEDLSTGRYSHFVANDGPNVGHLDGLLATDNALFLADLSPPGPLGAAGAGRGVIYEVVATN